MTYTIDAYHITKNGTISTRTKANNLEKERDKNIVSGETFLLLFNMAGSMARNGANQRDLSPSRAKLHTGKGRKKKRSRITSTPPNVGKP